MSKNLKSFKKITCILGITFLVLGMIPLPVVSRITTAVASVSEKRLQGLPDLEGLSLLDRTSPGPDCVYSEWGACSETCGGGTQTRTVVSGPGGCNDLTQSCNTQACPCVPGGTELCPTACGYAGGTVSDGCGGSVTCAANPACGPTCKPKGDSCSQSDDCCSGNCNGVNGKCADPNSQCKGEGGPCGGDNVCCPGLVCNADPTKESDKCWPVPPPNVNCVGSWSSCVGNCGTGIETYTITVPQSGTGTQCEAANGATRSCTLAPCVVDCVGHWTDCDKTCGGGSQTFVVDTPASNGGQACEFNDQATRACNTNPCPIDCVGHFNACSTQCGPGVQTYEITTPAQNGGAACAYADGATIPCTGNPPCPVNCVGDWGPCTGDCGTAGSRTFTITTPAANGGTGCAYANGATEVCQMPTCPLNCVGSWGPCVGECGVTGTRTFTITQQADPGGVGCAAENGATQECQGPPCPIDCEWGEWSECSVSCGGGTQTRSIAVQAANGGTECEGPTSKDCNKKACTPPPSGGGGTGAGGPTEPLIIPVTGVDLSLSLAGLQSLFMYMGLMLFGITMVLEGIDRKRMK